MIAMAWGTTYLMHSTLLIAAVAIASLFVV
jgi:hypothetical protein